MTRSGVGFLIVQSTTWSPPPHRMTGVTSGYVDQPGVANSLLAAFERLTGAITAGEVSAMPPMGDEVRLPWRDMFIRRPPAQTTPVLVSYVPEDRIWAEWIEFALKQAGLRVVLRCAVPVAADSDSGETGHAAGSSSHAIAVLSKAYLTAPEARTTWDAMAAVGPGPRLVPVKVSEVRLTEPFDTGDVVDLVPLDQDQAARALLEELGAPTQPSPRQVIDGEPRFPRAAHEPGYD